MFVPGKPFQPSLMFVGKARVKHLSILKISENYNSKKFYSAPGQESISSSFFGVNLLTLFVSYMFSKKCNKYSLSL
jgi:hypothetical protein